MSEHELEHLLGGFAAGTLTANEQQRLYAAALQDQRLFNALADEQSLKELLAEPDVRRQLLDALQRPLRQADPSRRWWDWFRTPTGLALAGGLAAALFAMTFGTRIFQEGFDRNTRSIATEEPPSSTAVPPSKPNALSLPPPAAEPSSHTQTSSAPPIPAPSVKREARRETAAKQQRTDAAKPAPAAESNHTTEQARVSEDRTRLAEEGPPPAPTAAPMLRPAPSALSKAAAPEPTKSARALYYGGVSPSAGAEARAKDNAAAGSTRVLGLRYSFVIRDRDGRNQEVSAAIAARSQEPVRLTVETTQDGFLQLLQNLGSSGTRLWWPPQETGKISLKATAGSRVDIPMPPPAESGLLDVVLRFSPKPFGPLTMQEVGMLDRFSGNLLIETVTSGAAGAEESATYAVNPEVTPAAQLAIDIPVSR